MIDFNTLIDKHLKRDSKPKEIGRYYPSEIGNCMRKVWYGYKNPKPVNGELIKIFKAGDMVHDFVAEVLRSEKTPEVTLLESEAPFRMNLGDFVISGRVDDILLLEVDGTRVLVEVKSTKFVEKMEPTQQHVMQLQMYMHALKIKKGVILYIEKNSLQSKSFEIEYDPDMIDGIMRRFRMLHECLKSGELPGPEARRSPEIGWMCNYCEYREECEGACSFSE